jgi:hypothetical protein
MTHAAQSLFGSSQKIIGFTSSFFNYSGMPFHDRALTQIYAPFICHGDLCFDVGAHHRLAISSRNAPLRHVRPDCHSGDEDARLLLK